MKLGEVELLVMLADSDAEALITPLIKRGQERRCLRQFQWRPVRNPRGRHDEYWRRPEEIIPPRLPDTTRLLLLWDHHGSGRETRLPEEVERAAAALLKRQGLDEERFVCVALSPELEGLLYPAWEKVKEILAAERKVIAPDDAAILQRAQRLMKGPVPRDTQMQEAVQRYPKEMLEALKQILRLGSLGAVHQILGERLSLPLLKGKRDGIQKQEARDANRIADALVRWFPGPAQGVSPLTMV